MDLTGRLSLRPFYRFTTTKQEYSIAVEGFHLLHFSHKIYYSLVSDLGLILASPIPVLAVVDIEHVMVAADRYRKQHKYEQIDSGAQRIFEC